MTQFYSRSDTVFNGDVYSIPFSYTEKNEINVYIDDVIFSNWLFLNDSQIQLTSIPEGVTSESVVSIRRTTDITKPIVEYSNNTMLTKEALNSSQNQLLNAIQEVYDNNEEFKIETNNNLITNKQEILNIQSDFKDEVNTKIQQVSDAAAKINQLEDAVNTAVTSANIATEKANMAGAEVEKAKTEVTKATQQANLATETVQNSLTNIESKTLEEINKIKQTGFYMEGDKLYYIDSNGETKEFKSNSFVLGTIYQVTGKIDESENLFRYANGQVVIEDDSIKGLTAFLDKQEKLGNTSIFCTEEEWQAEKTLSKFGQCGKYVRDKEAGTLRLPAIVNLQGVMDLTNVGVTKAESLPNIKGRVGGVRRTDNLQEPTDSALYWNKQDYVQKAVETAGTASADIAIDLSRNNSTYQDNAPVQQEAIQYPYVICVNTGTAEEPERPINNYMVNNPFSFGVSQYYKGEMNNLSWLRSNGQKNYKAVYPDFYNWALGQLNAGVEGFKNHTDENITDYDFVINQSDESFILPLKNGMETIIDYSQGTDISSYTSSDNQFKAPSRGIILLAGNASEYGYINNHRFATRQSDSDIYVNNQTIHLNKGDSYYGNYEFAGPNDLSNKFFPYVGDGNLYYFAGETMQNSNLANLGRIEETLVNKVDTDLNNMNPSQPVKKTFLSWELPDYSASVATLTAPCEGWFNVNTVVVPNGGTYVTNINGVNVETYSAPSGAVRVAGSMYRVSEGDVIVSTGNVQFFPCKGVSNV